METTLSVGTDSPHPVPEAVTKWLHHSFVTSVALICHFQSSFRMTLTINLSKSTYGSKKRVTLFRSTSGIEQKISATNSNSPRENHRLIIARKNGEFDKT